MISAIFEQFILKDTASHIEATPVTVMVRGIMERIFEPTALNELFERHAVKQYTRELLFSDVVSLMSLVVSGIHPSVSAAYKALEKTIGVSRPAFYGKLNGMELGISQALVRYSVSNLQPIMSELGSVSQELLPGYNLRISDGNHLGATEHRLKVLQNNLSRPLPGQSIAVLDPQQKLVVDIFLNEDGHAQERSLLPSVLETVEAKQVWVADGCGLGGFPQKQPVQEADRNFCTRKFLLGIAQREGYFIVREHKSIPHQELSPLKEMGETETGRLFEQKVQVEEDGVSLNLRRVVIQLHQPTRHGDTEVALLTHLSPSVADAPTVARLYLQRWSIEGMFQVITDTFNCELNTLGYPKAALFVFCLAIVAFNILSTVKAALKSVHGVGKIEAGLSDYYLVEEIQGTFRGLAIALPTSLWSFFLQMNTVEFVTRS
jgi:hypothetical protein